MKAFQKILNESKHKPNKIWVDKGSKFYNRLMEPILQNDIEMYSTQNLLLLKDSLEPLQIHDFSFKKRLY